MTDERIAELESQLEAADAVASAADCFVEPDDFLGPDDCDYEDLEKALAVYYKARESK